LGGDEGIDLGQRTVGHLEGDVERGHELHRLVDLRGCEPQSKRQLARLEGLQAHSRNDVLFQDRFRILGCDLLDLHAARGRGHEDGTRFGAVNHDPQVQFAIDGQRLLDQQATHLFAFRAGLVRDQLHTQHAAGDLAGFFGGVGDLHPAALAAPAGVDLRLHHHRLRAGSEQVFGGVLRRFAGGHHLAAGHRDAILRQDCFRLVLVNFHGRGIRTKCFLSRLLPVICKPAILQNRSAAGNWLLAVSS
jgi:hypothetical protein